MQAQMGIGVFMIRSNHLGILNLIFCHFFCHIVAKPRLPVVSGGGNWTTRQNTGNFLTCPGWDLNQRQWWETASSQWQCLRQHSCTLCESDFVLPTNSSGFSHVTMSYGRRQHWIIHTMVYTHLGIVASPLQDLFSIVFHLFWTPWQIHI